MTRSYRKPDCASCFWCMTVREPDISSAHCECAYEPPRVVCLSTIYHRERPHVLKGEYCHNYKQKGGRK